MTRGVGAESRRGREEREHPSVTIIDAMGIPDRQQPWPYNLPIWRRSHRAVSPDGRIVAEIAQADEVSMGNPTMGRLLLSTGLEVPRCRPSFIWSVDSR